MPQPAKFLIVDDEVAVVEFVGAMISKCGWELRTACSGEEAIEVAKAFLPDCVITGIMMPHGDGFYEAREILKFHPASRFIFASGAAYDPQVRETHKQMGFDPVFLIPKPFTRAELLRLIELAGFLCPSQTS